MENFQGIFINKFIFTTELCEAILNSKNEENNYINKNNRNINNKYIEKYRTGIYC